MDQKDKYFDFSEDNKIIEGFRAGINTHKWEKALAEEIQTALRRENPVSGLKQLLGFNTATLAYLQRAQLKSLRTIRILLFINTGLLAIIAILLFQ